jgi:hypothetical protein
MSCSMTTIVSCRFSSATSSASRAVASAPEAGGRLVEEQEPRRGGERHRDLERPPLAVGEAPGAEVLLAGEADARQHRGGMLLRRGIGAQVAPDVEAARPHFGQGQDHVVERRAVVEQVHRLERARDAAPRDPARRLAGDVDAGEAHRAAVGREPAGQHIEAGGLAGSVRTHDPRELALLELQAQVLQDDPVAEALVQVRGFKEGHARPLSPRSAAAPCRPDAHPAASAPRRLPDAGDAFRLDQHHRHEQRPYQSSQVSVVAPSTSRARMKKTAPISGPQKLTRPPPISTIMTTKPDECRLITFG